MKMHTLSILSPDILSAQTRKEIDQWLLKFPENKKQSAVLSALTIVQAENGGFLTTELMRAVAVYLQMPAIAVYEVATFYTLFELSPVGTYKIFLCTNVSCMLRNSEGIADHLKKKLEIDFGETTLDKRFTLKEVECLGACGGAPVMQLGSTYYENLTPEKIDSLLDNLP